MYIDVIVPLPLSGMFTYFVPENLSDKVQTGMRVVVPFGRKKMYTAIVSLIHTHKPSLVYEPKEILFFPDEKPILRYPQLKFWNWISAYYCANLGDVYQAAVPAGLKPESETQVRINMDFEGGLSLSERELKILDALSDGKIQNVSYISKLTGINNIFPILTVLLLKGAIEVSEEINERYAPKTENYVRLTDFASTEENLRQILDKMTKTPKRLDLLMNYIQLSGCLTPTNQKEVPKKELLEKSNGSAAVLQGLVAKGILEVYSKEIGRLNYQGGKTTEVFQLNEFQQQALREIKQQFQEKHTVLLHGVTSSGKTELYNHLIKQVLEEKKQVLYLVPEIALTTQLTSRLKRIFGEKLGVYHSKFSDAERVEIWNNVLNEKGYEVIIGVRSSIFLPFRQLGLIIVDEEHEPSYKQFDPAPRYHARNAAIMLASMHNAKTLLGTATPAIESYFNAKNGKYGYVELGKRFQEMELPEILVENTKELYHRKEMEGHFSPVLLEKTRKALEKKEQILLFQNRRGYAPFLECRSCAYIPKCENCDVSLTVHKFLNKLTCHYCGFTQNIPDICPVCKTPHLEHRGFGTEKIEDEVREKFPEAKISRMDTDTTRSKKSYEKILTDFEQGKVDVLVGTQMISKGLDFERVSLVGVLNADNLLNFPDFRAWERAYQLITQVSGRAGRKNKRGTVVVQTSNPEHPIIGQIKRNDFEGMYNLQISERSVFKYPPYVRLIEITIRHKDAKVNDKAAETLAIGIRKTFGSRLLGPNVPIVSRIQNLFIKQLLLKLEPEISAEQAKNLLLKQIAEFLALPAFKSIRVSVDVDPM